MRLQVHVSQQILPEKETEFYRLQPLAAKILHLLNMPVAGQMELQEHVLRQILL